MTVLFVYGTLRTGERNHRFIADQVYLGPAATMPQYRTLDLGAYPGMVAGRDAVRGELWRVSDCCLAELDDFEGVPTLFDRRPVELADGTAAEAYFWAGS